MRPGLGRRWTCTNLWRLVILYDATQRSFGRTQGTVQHVNVNLSSLVLAFQSAANFKPPALCKVIRGTRK
jgi:hypothetical protein